MFNIKKVSLLALILVAGCTREIYLQPVPCPTCGVEEEAVAAPILCYDNVECCQDTFMYSETITYQVYDTPTPNVIITPMDNGFKRCRQNCRKIYK